MGQHYDSALAAVVTNTIPNGVPLWSPAAHPYLTSISATNLGIYNRDAQNTPLEGDVLVGYFKPLHESFDGTNYQNQEYFMILNGLAWNAASVAETRQAITVNFDFGTNNISGLQRLRRSDGQVESIAAGGTYSNLTWTRTGAATYQLVVTLDGGTADLFKFDTGAPFVGTTPGRTISITRSGTDVILSWPLPTTAVVLEATTALVPAAWGSVAAPAVTNASTVSVTVPATGTKFYRLRQL